MSIFQVIFVIFLPRPTSTRLGRRTAPASRDRLHARSTENSRFVSAYRVESKTKGVLYNTPTRGRGEFRILDCWAGVCQPNNPKFGYIRARKRQGKRAVSRYLAFKFD